MNYILLYVLKTLWEGQKKHMSLTPCNPSP